MLLNVKVLQGEECAIEVPDCSTVGDMKEIAIKQLDIPDDAGVRVLFKGKTLLESNTLEEYKIANGSKLHFLVKKEEYEKGTPEHHLVVTLKKVLSPHFRVSEVEAIVKEFLSLLETSVNSLSLDDIERMARELSQDMHSKN